MERENKKEEGMKFILYICGIIAFIVGLYELTWIGRSSLAVVIMLLAFIIAVNSCAIARKKK